MKEKEEEELALFRELQKREKDRNGFLLQKSGEIDDAPVEAKPFKSPISRFFPRKSRAEEFLNSENHKTDFDWLLTPPKTPLFPSLEMESQRTVTDRPRVMNAHQMALNSRLANPLIEAVSRGNAASRQQALSASLNSSSGGNRRSLSSGRPASIASRPATPTSRPTLPVNARTARPSTPTSRASYPSAKPNAPVRSSTPTRSSVRPSTPTSRTSIPASKSTSRSATPTRRPSTPSRVSNNSVRPGQSAAVAKSVTSDSKNSVPSRGSSPTVKSRPWNPSEMPGFSLEAPPNLRTTLPGRPASASRGRPAAPGARSSSAEVGRPRQQSCSPSRVRAQPGRSCSSSISRAHSNGNDNDNVSPVARGTKMVERVVNMRKLAPPKHDDNVPSLKKSIGKTSSSSDCSGFGRSLSKISLDMAMRHMDIGQSGRSNLRPLMTKVPASSMYSVRSGQTSRTNSFSGSPLATSSTASSDISLQNNSQCFEGSEVEDSDLGSERCQLSPAALRGR